MQRGRPTKSTIRDRMSEIINVLGVSYGYEIFKVYTAAFSKISMRSMYYHLNKGVQLGEFTLVGVKIEKGDYTWGDSVVRRYYVLGKSKKPPQNQDLVGIINSLGLKKRN